MLNFWKGKKSTEEGPNSQEVTAIRVTGKKDGEPLKGETISLVGYGLPQLDRYLGEDGDTFIKLEHPENVVGKTVNVYSGGKKAGEYEVLTEAPGGVFVISFDLTKEAGKEEKKAESHGEHGGDHEHSGDHKPEAKKISWNFYIWLGFVLVLIVGVAYLITDKPAEAQGLVSGAVDLLFIEQMMTYGVLVFCGLAVIGRLRMEQWPDILGSVVGVGSAVLAGIQWDKIDRTTSLVGLPQVSIDMITKANMAYFGWGCALFAVAFLAAYITAMQNTADFTIIAADWAVAALIVLKTSFHFGILPMWTDLDLATLFFTIAAFHFMVDMFQVPAWLLKKSIGSPIWPILFLLITGVCFYALLAKDVAAPLALFLTGGIVGMVAELAEKVKKDTSGSNSGGGDWFNRVITNVLKSNFVDGVLFCILGIMLAYLRGFVH